MESRLTRLVCALCLLALALMASPVLASRGPTPPLQPKEYASPDGRTVVRINPLQRYGAGAAVYTHRVGGVEKWTRELPFTLCGATVSDTGRLVGYAYTRGMYGGAWKEQSFGDIVVAVIDENGDVLLEDHTKREFSPYFDAPPTPTVAGFEYDPTTARMLVRFRDDKIERGNDTLLIVDVTAPKMIDRFAIHDRLDPPDGRLADCRLIPDTPLLFLYIWGSTPGTLEGEPRFYVIDNSGAVAWQYKLPSRRMNWRDEIVKGVAPGGRFAFLDQEKEAVRHFEATKGNDGVWTITETDVFDVIAKPPTGEIPFPTLVQAAMEDFPARDLEPVGTITLERPEDPWSPIRNVREFCFDDDGNIVFVNTVESPACLYVINRKAEVVDKLPLGTDEIPIGNLNQISHAGARRFLGVAVKPRKSEDEPHNPSRVWCIDLDTRTAIPYDDIDVSGIWNLAAHTDGSFALISWKTANINNGKHLRCFDRDGNLRWSIEEDNSGAWDRFYSPADVAFTSTGEVAVLCKFPDKVLFHAPDGTKLETYRLEASFGKKPNYVSSIWPDADGGVVIYDFNGTPAMLRLTRGGESAGTLPRPARTDRHFAFWYTDGYTFRRMDTGGAVVEMTGSEPQSDQIGELLDSFISPSGTIYILSKDTLAVHVYTDEGKRLFIASPPGEFDIPATQRSGDLIVMPSGEIHVRVEGGSSRAKALTWRYTAEGAYMGESPLFPSESYAPGFGGQIARDCVWRLGYQEIALIAATGDVLKSIDRRVGDYWVEYPRNEHIAPDGSILYFDSAPGASWAAGSSVAYIHDPDGVPVSGFLLPGKLTPYLPGAFGGSLYATWFEGALYVLNTDGSAAFRFDMPDSREKAWTPYFPRDEREIWLFDGQKTIRRFRIGET